MGQGRPRDGIPFDEELGIHPQDSHFLEREVWDLQSPATAKRPLLLHYHPLVIYRFQVLKQADVVLALFLQGQHFTLEQKRKNFEYYDPITTGDSTLSAVVQSIIAAEVGYDDLALRYFIQGLYVDLANLHGNSSDGVHVASTGGIWSALAFGFGGMRDHGGAICFDPRLPASWERLSLPDHAARGPGSGSTSPRSEMTFTVEDGRRCVLLGTRRRGRLDQRGSGHGGAGRPGADDRRRPQGPQSARCRACLRRAGRHP